MKRKMFIVLALPFSFSASAKIVEKTVAIVNDQAILLTDVENFKQKLGSEGLVDDALLQLSDRAQLTKDRNALVNYLIDEALIDTEVKKRNLDVTFERVEQEIRTILRSKHLTRNQLKDLLAEKGTSMSDYQAFIKTSIERQSLIEREVSSRIKISDEDVAAYFQTQKGHRASQAYEYSLAHILFLPRNGGEKAAVARANAVIEKLRGSVEFEKIAEQNSEDPNFSQGGFLGNFRSGEMSKEIEDGVRNLGPGELSAVVKTKMGVHVIKVLKKTITADPELDEKREEIRSRLFAEAFKRQFQSWLRQRRDEAFIRLNENGDGKAS